MTRRFVHIFAALILTGCAGIRFDGSFKPDDDDWTTYAGSDRRSNYSRSDLEPPFASEWTYSAQGGVLATPLVRDNVLIIATLHGELQMVSLTDGKRIGYVTLGAPIRGTPILSGLHVIVPMVSDESSLAYFSLRDGRTVWKIDAGPIESSPLLLGEKVYVSTLDGEVRCIEKSNGEEIWRYAPQNKDDRKPFRSSPVGVGDLIVCGNDDGIVYAVRASDGVPVWSEATEAPVFVAPLAEKGDVIVANIRGDVLRLDGATGERRWKKDLAAPVYASPSSDGVMLYVATASGVITALDPGTGESLWSWRGESVINASPLVSEHHIYVGTLGKKFYVLRKSNGETLWTRELEGRMKVPAVTWKDHLIIVYEDKTVEALRPSDSP